MHPAQQQGLRMPPLIFEIPFLIRMSLVSAFLPEVSQQIHSLRARGVMSSQTASNFGSAVRTFLKSSGVLCTVPFEIFIPTFYQIIYHFPIRLVYYSYEQRTKTWGESILLLSIKEDNSRCFPVYFGIYFLLSKHHHHFQYDFCFAA